MRAFHAVLECNMKRTVSRLQPDKTQHRKEVRSDGDSLGLKFKIVCACLTSSVGGVHSFRRQTELAEEGSQLPGGQGTAEHTHGLKGDESQPPIND